MTLFNQLIVRVIRRLKKPVKRGPRYCWSKCCWKCLLWRSGCWCWWSAESRGRLQDSAEVVGPELGGCVYLSFGQAGVHRVYTGRYAEHGHTVYCTDHNTDRYSHSCVHPVYTVRSKDRYTGCRQKNKQPKKGSLCLTDRTQQSHTGCRSVTPLLTYIQG